MELTNENAGIGPEQSLPRSACAVVSDWYDRYGTDVLRLCYMYMRNRMDAEDATQETFLKIWLNLDRFEGRNHCSARSWIMRIACNTCRDQLRKGWRKHEERRLTPEDLPAAESVSHEDIELLMDVMNLPDKYRIVLLMVYWQGMTIKETADMIGAGQSTVSRRLEKARSMIEG